MNTVKALVYAVVGICILGALFSGGQIQALFEQMLALLAVFILVVELVPQFIVADEKEISKEPKP